MTVPHVVCGLTSISEYAMLGGQCEGHFDVLKHVFTCMSVMSIAGDHRGSHQVHRQAALYSDDKAAPQRSR